MTPGRRLVLAVCRIVPRAEAKAVHRYEAGMAYSAQRYTGTNPASLASVAEGTRTAGAVFAFDTWTLSRRATLVYGGRVARYGYIDKALFSPRARLEIAATDHLRFSVERRRTRRGARRRGVRAVERLGNVAAARAHVRSARRHALPSRAHAHVRDRDRAGSRHRGRARHAHVLPAHRRPGGHAVRPRPRARGGRPRPLLRVVRG